MPGRTSVTPSTKAPTRAVGVEPTLISASVDPAAPAQRGRLDQVEDLALGEPPQLVRGACPVGVAGVGEQPDHLDAGDPGDEADQLGGGRAGRAAEPVQPGVDLDQHLHVAAAGAADAAEPLGHLDRVKADPDPGPLQQVAEPAELGLPHQRIGDQQVVEAGVGHHLGLAQLGAGDPGGTGLDLHPGDLGRLVGLGVGAEPDPGPAGDGGHLGQVRLQRVQVDQQRRGVQLREGRAGRAQPGAAPGGGPARMTRPVSRSKKWNRAGLTESRIWLPGSATQLASTAAVKTLVPSGATSGIGVPASGSSSTPSTCTGGVSTVNSTWASEPRSSTTSAVTSMTGSRSSCQTSASSKSDGRIPRITLRPL